MKNPLSKKQINSYIQSNSRLNIWEGAVRSGKSFISLLRFVKELYSGASGQAMIVGVSRDAIQRNVVLEICAIMGMPAPTPKASQMNILGRTIHLVGANDERAQRRIQGSTIAIAYVDEITLIPHGFFKMLLSRLSVTGARLFGTTNPDSPFHWLKTEFLNKPDLDLNIFRFKLEDNPSLGEDYVNSLKKEYSGLWYKRYINGEWVLAEGTVYDFFDEDDHVIDTPPGFAEYYVIGIDYGTCNPTTFSLIGYNRKYYPNLWLEKEYYYCSKKHNRQKTDTEYCEDLISFIGDKNVRAIYVDPSAASFKNELMRANVGGIINADNDVLNGIRFVSNLLCNGTFKVLRCCENTRRELQTYRWDEKASDKGEDKPIKEYDHCFIAGTKITTEFGQIPIQDIKVGTKVKTRSGWNKVLKTFKSKADVEEFEILGKKITCTPSHKFLTISGWKEACNVLQSDLLFVDIGKCTWLKSLNLKEKNIDFIHNLNTIITKTITKTEEEKVYIELCGNSTMEKFPLDTIFITLTEIPSTIVLATLDVCQLAHIFPITPRIYQKIKKKLEEKDGKCSKVLEQNRLKQKKEGKEGVELPLNTGKQNLQWDLNVNSAKKQVLPNALESQGFVRVSVGRKRAGKIELILRKESALDVLKSLIVTNTPKLNIAHAHVQRKTIGKTDVYNLHVENEHEFFVEGILTHNCLDGMRYALYTHFLHTFSNQFSDKDLDKMYQDVVGTQTQLPLFFQDQANDQKFNGYVGF